jgi:hypothetical protein
MLRKRQFTYPERYAVWHCHGRRCWLCPKPLRLEDATIDHFFPESLLEDDDRRQRVLAEYGLSDDFDINGFGNWLPSHARCNQTKGPTTLRFMPGLAFMLEKLIRLAPKVERTARGISASATKDEVFARLFVALEQRAISTDDLRQLFRKLVEEPAPAVDPGDIILLDGGYWVHRKDVVREGQCRCERKSCVERPDKVYCYFRPDLSPWVVKTGLYWKCYDEIVRCPRCSQSHKRGHIGRDGTCQRPFRDQESQTD